MITKCPQCGREIEPAFELTPNMPHYGRLTCIICGKVWWAKKPENLNKRTETSSFSLEQIAKFHNKIVIFCFLCLRERSQLGLKETFEIDHIQELQKGGKDELGNLQILCTACHSIKNWLRLYLNWHSRKSDNDTEDAPRELF